MISIKRLGFNFINVPKNASTSIRRFFIDNVVQPEDVFSDYYESEEETWSQNMEIVHASQSHMDVTYAIENGLLDPTQEIVGVVREPVERVLSLYLYRAKQSLIVSPSIQDFRNSVTANGYFPDYPWQNQLQSSFLEYEGKEIGSWWLFDRISDHLETFAKVHTIQVREPLRFQNRSLRDQKTKDFVNTFYDAASLKAVHKYYEADIELYNRIKNASPNQEV